MSPPLELLSEMLPCIVPPYNKMESPPLSPCQEIWDDRLNCYKSWVSHIGLNPDASGFDWFGLRIRASPQTPASIHSPALAPHLQLRRTADSTQRSAILYVCMSVLEFSITLNTLVTDSCINWMRENYNGVIEVDLRCYTGLWVHQDKQCTVYLWYRGVSRE